jgi:hypothetical protein
MSLLNVLFVVLISPFISGLIADIDIESEKFRWMGSARIDFYVCLVDKFDNYCIAVVKLLVRLYDSTGCSLIELKGCFYLLGFAGSSEDNMFKTIQWTNFISTGSWV